MIGGCSEILTVKRVVGHLLDCYTSQVIKTGMLIEKFFKLVSVCS